MKRKTLTELRNLKKPELVDYADRISAFNAAIEKELSDLNELIDSQRDAIEQLEGEVEQVGKKLKTGLESLSNLEKAFRRATANCAELSITVNAFERLLLRAIHLRPEEQLGQTKEAKDA